MGVSKVDFAGNTLVDLTGDSVTPETLLEGATAHNASGDQIAGAVTVAPASNTTPKAPGTASAGSEDAYARGDHVHPSDPTKQNKTDEIQAIRLRGGINSIINNSSAVSINPAINAIGYLIHNGGSVQIFYDGYLMPFQDWEIDKLFDGKSSTYINFGSGPNNARTACLWSATTNYPQNARVVYQTASGVFHWYKALKESQGVAPEGDSTGAWTDISVPNDLNNMRVSNLDVSIVIDAPVSFNYENGISLYWRAAGQNCSYYKIEIYDDVANQYVLVAERNNIINDEVVSTQYMGATINGTGRRSRITFRAQPWNEGGWFAATQIALTGIRGGIEGTLVNRGGSTMYGNLSPYKSGGASLGTNSARWNEVHANKFYGDGSNLTKIPYPVTSVNGGTGAVTVREVPAVTTADNGKFLRVASGAWAAVEIANANGGSF